MVSSGILAKSTLVLSQEVGKETVDRELSILATTEVTAGDKKATGKEGLNLLAEMIGATVQATCNKDWKALRVTVEGKKKA